MCAYDQLYPFWLLLLSLCLLKRFETFLRVEKNCLLSIEFFFLLSAYTVSVTSVKTIATMSCGYRNGTSPIVIIITTVLAQFMHVV